MRIVILSRFFWPDLGGAQNQLRMLAREWVRQGHDVTILTCRWEESWPEEETIDGYRVLRWPVTRTRFVGTVRFLAQIRSWLREHRKDFDVLMVSMLKHAAWVATRSARQLGFPIFLKSWGAGDSGDMAWQRWGNFGQIIRKGTRDVDGVLAPSSAVADELSAAGYVRIHLVPNGVPVSDVPWTRREVSRWRRELGWEDRPTLVTTGRFSPEKGLLDLLDAIPRVRDRHPDLQLVLVGEGPQRPQLEERCRTLGIEDVVRMPGAVADVEPCLRAADLYLLPSHFEGLSVALLEALVLGLPCLASDTPANQGILPEELLPLFPVRSPTALADAILRELARTDEGETRSAKIRAEASRHYGIESVARAHVELFQSAAERI